MVEFRDVYKVYSNGTVALQDINLTVNEGEFIFIVGASGAGKSTLVKLMLKEEQASSGDVIIKGYVLDNIDAGGIPYLRRNMGIVFQDFRLLRKKTVYENIAFAMEIVGASPREIRRKAPMALSLVGLSRKADVFPSELSGGEQQRVALARAIVNNPPILVADEPTGNLDPETSIDIMSLLSEINHRGTTVIVATHERDIVDMMQMRVVEIDRGVIVRDQEKGHYWDESENDEGYL